MQFNQDSKKFLTPEMMKQTSQMCANMSDDQLRQYAQMAGMGNIDPSFLRQTMGQMRIYKDKSIKLVQKTQREQNREFRVSKHNNNNSNSKNHRVSNFRSLTKLKNQGNDAFKQQDYEKAASKYYEAISEIEELWENNAYLKNDANKKIELKQLEHSCRLNYCNVKAKQSQFDVVLRQAKKVLEDDDQNGKANFRMGQALFETKRYTEALGYLEIASQKLPADETVQVMYKQTKELQNSNIDQTQKQNSDDPQEKQEQKVEQTKIVQEDEPIQNQQQQQPQQIYKDKKENKDLEEEAQKKPKIKLSSVDTNSEEFQNLKQKVQSTKEDGFIVEEEIPTSKSQPTKPATKQNETQNVNKIPENPQFQQQFDQFKNMSPEQLNYMTNTLKSMDKGFLKQMMKQQSGVEMSDQQIEMMQTMMTPEMLAQMKNVDPAVLQQQKLSQQSQQFAQQQPIQSTSQSNNQNAPQAPQAPTASQQMPQNLQGLAQNPQMLEMVIDQLKSNPQMLKMMAPAFGGNNAITSYIESASPEQLSKVVGRLAIFLKFLLMLYRGWLMAKNQWKFILGFLLAYLYFKLF
ncbi:unnamed protein product (macronuclear) [Paramecium tetraurelia]|uniref:STI1 domain-containing protein n=1 Tax=Paramecium tetraurelia TaxID=5888 RepID=A0BFQ4_PARTE|nr:uncharacterized protein GSPATT00028406001 [Paramecium tetraurelia]CAK57371.1 unnamed protein product [Paramecium tetraurelia]|eukprot:XP_001424769.1 hypothetical protein (macronuclear) [Paramecium tetraurelia strain d4-2]